MNVWMGWTRFESTYQYGTPEALSRMQYNGHAYGMYQFDYQYGLVPFMQFCVNHNSSLYSPFTPFIQLGAGNPSLIGNTQLHNLFIEYANNNTEDFLYCQNNVGVAQYLTPALAVSGYSGLDPYILGSIFSFSIRNGPEGGVSKAAYAKIVTGDVRGAYQTFFNHYGDERWNPNSTSYGNSQYATLTQDEAEQAFVYDIESSTPVTPVTNAGNPLYVLHILGVI